MAYTLKIHGVVIGRSELEHRDATSRAAWGDFRAGAGYELVEPVFALRETGVDTERYRKALDALALELYDAHGTRLDASAITIRPSDGAPSQMQMRATVLDPRFWEGG